MGSPQPTLSYFGIQASFGITKHMGGRRATDALAQMCCLGPNSYFLVIGCGIGATPSYLAQKIGCRGMGIDLSEGMVDWSRKRAQQAGVAGRLEFRVADAQQLPFEDGFFDAVLCESVNAFIPVRPRAFHEYARVTRLGEYVGINECAWVQTPPQELIDFTYRAMDGPTFLTPAGWRELPAEAGLVNIQSQERRVNAFGQWRDEMEMAGKGEMGERFQAWNRFMGLLLKSPEFRRYARSLVPSPKVVTSLFRCLGYILCAGQK